MNKDELIWVTNYYKTLLKEAVKIAYKDSDTMTEYNLIKLIDSFEVQKK